MWSVEYIYIIRFPFGEPISHNHRPQAFFKDGRLSIEITMGLTDATLQRPAGVRGGIERDRSIEEENAVKKR